MNGLELLIPMFLFLVIGANRVRNILKEIREE